MGQQVRHPRTWEMEAGGSEAQGHPALHETLSPTKQNNNKTKTKVENITM